MIPLKMFLITSSFKLSGEISCLFTASIWQATICCLLLLIFLKTKAVSVLALKIQRFSYGLLPPCIVSTPVNRGRWCGGGVGKSISTILWEGVFEDLFGGGSWWERGVRDFRDNNYNFYITNPIWLTIYMRTERCCIACYFSLTFLAYFVLLNYLLIVFVLFY